MRFPFVYGLSTTERELCPAMWGPDLVSAFPLPNFIAEWRPCQAPKMVWKMAAMKSRGCK